MVCQAGLAANGLIQAGSRKTKAAASCGEQPQYGAQRVKALERHHDCVYHV